MLKNKSTLLKVSEPYKSQREILLELLERILKEIDPEKLTTEAINLKKWNLSEYKNIYLIAAGKASYKMAKAVYGLLGNKIKKGIIVSNEKFSHKIPKIECLKSTHPIPSIAGVKCAKKIIDFAKKINEKDLVIFLLSGGASAMLPLPVSEIMLKDKISVTKLLLKSEAAISEINTVRKHLSQIKGGRLAELLYPAKIICLALSDVIGNDPSIIASGPISPDETTFLDALKVIKKYKLENKISLRVKKYLIKALKNSDLETPKKNDPCFKKIEYRIIGSHETLLRASERAARKYKFKTRIIKKFVTGEAKKIGQTLVQKCKNGLLIAVGETTVNVKGNGYGGRNQELVLGALKRLKENQVILAVGTDGVDGITPRKVAGALADQFIAKKYPKLNIEQYLKNNNSYKFFLKTKTLIVTENTGNNLGDLIMILSV